LIDWFKEGFGCPSFFYDDQILMLFIATDVLSKVVAILLFL